MFLHFICAFFFFTTSMTPSPLSVSSDGMKEQNQYHFAKAAASPQWCSSRICLFAPDIDHEITAWPSMTILTPVHGVWFHFQYYHLSLIVPSSFTSPYLYVPVSFMWMMVKCNTTLQLFLLYFRLPWDTLPGLSVYGSCNPCSLHKRASKNWPIRELGTHWS